MRKLPIAALAVLVMSCSQNDTTQVSPAISPDEQIEATVKKIVSDMSLEDKVGQMCEIAVDLVLSDSTLADGSPIADPTKLKTAFEQFRVGSVLNTPQGHAQTPEVWHNIISAIQDASMEYIGIPDRSIPSRSAVCAR